MSARPEGQRCLVIATSGATTSRLRNGSLLHANFPSALPNGSTAAQSTAQGPTVLDCIFQEASNSYWVLDAITWNGYLLADCNAECRLVFWVQAKLSELQPLPGAMPFLAAPFSSCTLSAYVTQLPSVTSAAQLPCTSAALHSVLNGKLAWTCS